MRGVKNYTVFPDEIVQYFKPRDIYVLSVLYLYAYSEVKIKKNEYLISDLTVEQISDYGNVSKDYVVESFIPRLKRSKYVLVETVQEKYKIKRNIYKLPKPNKNFRFIHKDILSDLLDPELKGFLVAMFCCCDYNTLHNRYNTTELLSEIKISRATFFRYKKELIGKNLFDNKMESIYGSQYDSGFDIRCSWLRIEPSLDSSMNTYTNPYAHEMSDF